MGNSKAGSSKSANDQSEKKMALEYFNHQPTRLVDATLAETLGLSMHNAVSSQLNSQMSTSASITSACNRLLGSSRAPEKKAAVTESKLIESIVEDKVPGLKKKSCFIKGWYKAWRRKHD